MIRYGWVCDRTLPRIARWEMKKGEKGETQFILLGRSFFSEKNMTQKRAYQLHLSRGDVVLKDVQGRTQKCNKILSVLRDFRQISSRSLCLDIGCSSGVMTSALGEHVGWAIGIDIDQDAVHYAKEHSPWPLAQFIIGDSMVLPFRECSVDVMVCNHIYEHVPQGRPDDG